MRVEETSTIASDQTGKFPVCASSGNKYIMVMVHIDGNAILVEPMKNRSEGEMIKAYQALINRLNRAGIFPKSTFWIMRHQKNSRKSYSRTR